MSAWDTAVNAVRESLPLLLDLAEAKRNSRVCDRYTGTPKRRTTNIQRRRIATTMTIRMNTETMMIICTTPIIIAQIQKMIKQAMVLAI